MPSYAIAHMHHSIRMKDPPPGSSRYSTIAAQADCSLTVPGAVCQEGLNDFLENIVRPVLRDLGPTELDESIDPDPTVGFRCVRTPSDDPEVVRTITRAYINHTPCDQRMVGEEAAIEHLRADGVLPEELIQLVARSARTIDLIRDEGHHD